MKHEHTEKDPCCKHKHSTTAHVHISCGCEHEHKPHGHADCCEHGHEHAHHDHDECHCAHEHEHEHTCHDLDDCCCEHSHETGHKYHEHSCGCGHENHEQECCTHEHDSCGCGCGCGHDHDHAADAGEIRVLAIRLGTGLLLLIGALALGGFLPGWLTTVMFAASYLIIGWPVLRETLEHLPRGHIFDENLLMTVASIGAFLLGDHAEAVLVVTLYQVGELLQGLAVAKSKKSIAETMNIRPDHANLLNEAGEVQEVAPEDVPAGSRILIRPGERIPLDCIVTEGMSALDTAALTGESLPREVAPGDILLSGSINLQGVLTAQTTQNFADSTVQRILKLTQESSARKSTTEKFITRFARVYTPVVFALAALLAVIPPLLGLGTWGDWVYRGLVFLVVSCPCALVISVPVGFLAGMGGAARHGVLLKGGAVLDRLCGATSIVFDKTGTLTNGTFTVTEVTPVKDSNEEELLSCAALCEADSTHPIARSVMLYCTDKTAPVEKDEVLELAGMGIAVTVAGSRYLAGNLRLMQHYGIALPSSPEAPVAGTPLYLARDDRFLGTMLIADTMKPGVPAALNALRRTGVQKLMLLSGDREAAVARLAGELQLDAWRAELLPQDKIAAFESLCSGEGPHIFVGDGINDAPLLARADVGIAMGGIGSDAAVEAADCVLMRDDIGSVALALRCARRTRSIVRQNIIFSLAAKGAVLIAAAFGYAPMWLAIFADVGVALLCILNATRAIVAK